MDDREKYMQQLVKVQREEKARRDYDWAMTCARNQGWMEGWTNSRIRYWLSEGFDNEIAGEIDAAFEAEIKTINDLQFNFGVFQTSRDLLSRLTLKQLQELTAKLRYRLKNPNSD